MYRQGLYKTQWYLVCLRYRPPPAQSAIQHRVHNHSNPYHVLYISRDCGGMLLYTVVGIFPEIVGECYWYDGQSTPHCGTVDGYQFDGPISDTVTLTIPVSSQHHAGVYRCDYINQNYSPEHGCDMYIRGQ